MIRRKFHSAPVKEIAGRSAPARVFHQSTAVIITMRYEIAFLYMKLVKEVMAVHKTFLGRVLTAIRPCLEPSSNPTISIENPLWVAFILCEKTSTVR